MTRPIIPAAEMEPTGVELTEARSIVEGRPYATATVNVGGRADYAAEALAKALAVGCASQVAALVRQMRADARVLGEYGTEKIRRGESDVGP